MRTSIQVSVIMPCYNAENYVVEAIDSILNQSLRDLELIIVNDGSTDNTEMLVRRFYDKRIRYLSLGNNQGNEHFPHLFDWWIFESVLHSALKTMRSSCNSTRSL